MYDILGYVMYVCMLSNVYMNVRFVMYIMYGMEWYVCMCYLYVYMLSYVCM